MIPDSYDQWLHCITVKCKITLTTEYAHARLTELRNIQDSRTIKFRGVYGDEHWRQVITWFERSLTDKGENPK